MITQSKLVVGEGSLTTVDALSPYIRQIIGDIHLMKPLKVAIDCGNGVLGFVRARCLNN